MRAYLPIGLLLLAVGCGPEPGASPSPTTEDEAKPANDKVSVIRLTDDDPTSFSPDTTRYCYLQDGKLMFEDAEAFPDLLTWGLMAGPEDTDGVVVLLEYEEEDRDAVNVALQEIRKAADPRVPTRVYVRRVEP